MKIKKGGVVRGRENGNGFHSTDASVLHMKYEPVKKLTCFIEINVRSINPS